MCGCNATIYLLELVTEPENSPSSREGSVPGFPNLGLSLEIVGKRSRIVDPTTGAVQSDRSGIHDLPNEIVEQNMDCLDGVLSFQALMTVYSQAWRIYQESTEATLFAVIRNSTMAPQF